jgi:hypothetical protein
MLRINRAIDRGVGRLDSESISQKAAFSGRDILRPVTSNTFCNAMVLSKFKHDCVAQSSLPIDTRPIAGQLYNETIHDN